MASLPKISLTKELNFISKGNIEFDIVGKYSFMTLKKLKLPTWEHLWRNEVEHLITKVGEFLWKFELLLLLCSYGVVTKQDKSVGCFTLP